MTDLTKDYWIPQMMDLAKWLWDLWEIDLPRGGGTKTIEPKQQESTQPCMHVINKHKCTDLPLHKLCNNTKPHRCNHEYNTQMSACTDASIHKKAFTFTSWRTKHTVRSDTSTPQQWSKQLLLLLGIFIAPCKRCWHYISCVGPAGASVCGFMLVGVCTH